MLLYLHLKLPLHNIKINIKFKLIIYNLNFSLLRPTLNTNTRTNQEDPGSKEKCLHSRTFFFFLFFLAALGLCCCTQAFSSAASRGYSWLRCRGFSLRWLLLLWSVGSWHVGIVIDRRIVNHCATREVPHLSTFNDTNFFSAFWTKGSTFSFTVFLMLYISSGFVSFIL